MSTSRRPSPRPLIVADQRTGSPKNKKNDRKMTESEEKTENDYIHKKIDANPSI